MKKVLIICAILISAVTLTKAQGGGGGGARGAQGTPEEQATATLARPNIAAFNLTDDQKAKITPILVAYTKANADAMTKAMAAGGDRQAAGAEVRTKMAPMAADSEKAIVALLTADQKKTYDAALATAKAANPMATAIFVGGRGGGRGGQGGGGR